MELTIKIKDNPLKKQEIIFENNKNKALITKADSNDSAENIISALQLQSSKPKSIILIFGGASGNLDTSDTSITILHQILDDVLQYAADNDAIIIDGGTKSGIMEIVGQRASKIEQSKKPIILGVAPAGLISLINSTKQEDNYKNEGDNDRENDKVLLDPNHSHFVLVEGDKWGDETIKLFEIASSLSTSDIPIVALLSGGGRISKKEILFCINQNWPVIVIEKTGYLADEIASYKNQKQTFEKISLDANNIKKIISYSSLKLFPSDSNQIKSFEQFLLYALNYDPLLESV
jgi:hypothetical protein